MLELHMNKIVGCISTSDHIILGAGGGRLRVPGSRAQWDYFHHVAPNGPSTGYRIGAVDIDPGVFDLQVVEASSQRKAPSPTSVRGGADGA